MSSVPRVGEDAGPKGAYRMPGEDGQVAWGSERPCSLLMREMQIQKQDSFPSSEWQGQVQKSDGSVLSVMRGDMELSHPARGRLSGDVDFGEQMSTLQKNFSAKNTGNSPEPQQQEKG